MDRFMVATGLLDEITTHALESFPEEACGIIGGPRNDLGSVLWRGENRAPMPRVSFDLDPETLTHLPELEDAGLALTAIYHSHPVGPQSPSSLDVSRVSRSYADIIMIICSLSDRSRPVLRGFGVSGGLVHEITLAPCDLVTLGRKRPNSHTLPAKDVELEPLS